MKRTLLLILIFVIYAILTVSVLDLIDAPVGNPLEHREENLHGK